MTFIILAYCISWLIWLPLMLNTLGLASLPTVPMQHYLAPIGSAAAALITILIFDGWKGLREFFRRVFIIPRNGKVLSIAFGVLVSGFCIALIVIRLSKGSSFSLANVELESPIPRNPLLVWFFWIVTYGLGEELGWRGFLLHETAGRFKAKRALLLTTVVWLFWHAPVFLYDPTFHQMLGPGMIGWILGLSAGSVFLSWG